MLARLLVPQVILLSSETVTHSPDSAVKTSRERYGQEGLAVSVSADSEVEI